MGSENLHLSVPNIYQVLIFPSYRYVERKCLSQNIFSTALKKPNNHESLFVKNISIASVKAILNWFATLEYAALLWLCLALEERPERKRFRNSKRLLYMISYISLAYNNVFLVVLLFCSAWRWKQSRWKLSHKYRHPLKLNSSYSCQCIILPGTNMVLVQKTLCFSNKRKHEKKGKYKQWRNKSQG